MSTDDEYDESSLKILQDNVNQLEKHFDQLRKEILSKLNDCSNCIKSTKHLCEQATYMNINLGKKLIHVSNEEKEWKDIKIRLATTSLKGMIILNVGGEKYTTSIETLTNEKDTFFTALFSQQWEVERDPNDKSIFIDRDGKLFHHILQYLRTTKVSNEIINNELLCHDLIIEAEYFRLHTFLNILREAEQKHQKEKERKEYLRINRNIPNGTLLQLEHKKKLNEFYGDFDQQWELIYKASRDGFDAQSFHSRCNNKGPTMTIIQSNNNCLFGGYTAISWSSENGCYKTDTTAFLFTLTNLHNIPPTKYLINPSQIGSAVYHHNDRGPTFGAGHDIFLTNGSNANNANVIHFPNSYIDTTGKGNLTFTGARNFIASEIEVFKLVV